MFEIKAIHHVSLIVADTCKALTFYVDILGMKIEPDRPDLGFPGAWLNIGKQQIHLLELPNPDPVSNRPDHGGRDRHLAVEVNDILSLKNKLDEKNVNFSMSKSGRKALFVRDPDGNTLEIIETG